MPLLVVERVQEERITQTLAMLQMSAVAEFITELTCIAEWP